MTPLSHAPTQASPPVDYWRFPLFSGCSLVLLCGFFYLWGLGDLPFYTKGEPREATIVWEIATSGEWVLPLRNGQTIPSKPPLFHWLGAILSLAYGEVNEWTIRLPSALLAILGVLLTYNAGVALWGVEAGLIAGVILATSFEWVRAATTARVDMTLTVCMVAALLFFPFLYRRARVSRLAAGFFFALLGLAVLAKGPVGVLLPGLIICIFLWLQGDLQFLQRLHPVSSSALLILIAGSWYGLALWHGGHTFFTKQIMQENILRFFAAHDSGAGHEQSWYFFVPNLFLGLAPWSFFFPPLAVFLYQRRRTWAASGFLYLIVWIATILVFYSASISKRTVYILPLYPAVALLLGAWWRELRQGTATLPGTFSWLLRGSGYVSLLTLGLAIVVVLSQILGYDILGLIRPLLHPRDQHNLPFLTGIASAHPFAVLAWFGLVIPSAFFLVRGIQRQHWGWVFITLVTFTLSTFLLVDSVFQSAVVAARTFQPFMARVVQHVGTTPMFFYHTFDHGALYYARRHIPSYNPTRLPSQSPYFLLMREEEWQKIAAQSGTGIHAVDVSEGTGPKGDHRLVLVFVPAGVTLPVQSQLPDGRDSPTNTNALDGSDPVWPQK